MININKTPSIDKNTLVRRIHDIFLDSQQYKYKRVLQEFFSKNNNFIGDNLLETTFKTLDNQAPIVYEVSGPYDTISNNYATIARVYRFGDLFYLCDIKSGIIQRTAAMVWLYIRELNHKMENVLIIGGGKVSLQVVEYLKHFSAKNASIDYSDKERKVNSFENPLAKIDIKVNYVDPIDFAIYDTIIMATNTNTCIINEENFLSIKPGSLIISLCTTSQSGEIFEEVYNKNNINIFLDYENTKDFTSEMRRANELGYLNKAIIFIDVLDRKVQYNLLSSVNIVRLTGTPMQNIALIDIMMESDGIKIPEL